MQNTLDARRAQLAARAAPATRRSTTRFVRLRRKLRRSQGVLAERLVEIYKADQPDMLSVILESDGFNDLLVRADYMSAIGAAGLGDRRHGARAEAASPRRSGCCWWC